MPLKLPRKKLALLTALCSTVLTACSGVNLLNAVVPSGGYQLRADVPYGGADQQHLDIYIPKAPWAGPGPRPTVMFVHGGSWQTGDKGMYKFVAEAITSRGWVAVIPDYRKYPQVRWPAFMEDCADAFNWTGAHAEEWGGDARHVLAMGHSAGAHMATLLALDPRYLARSHHPVLPAAVIGLSGPYDFLPITGPDIKEVFAPAANHLEQTQPIHFARAGAPPMLLLHGENDDTVWPKNTRNLAKRLRAEGAPVQDHVYPGLDHIRMVVSLARPFRFRYTVLDDIGQFVDTQVVHRAEPAAFSAASDTGAPGLQGAR